jgi:phytanoyl-CoA hydroxylase
MDAKFYSEEGYLLLKGFFRPEEISSIREEAKQVFITQMCRLGAAVSPVRSEHEFESGMYNLFAADLQTFINCGKQVQHLISLHKLSLDERIIGALKELGLAFPNVNTRPLVHFNSSRLAKKEVYWRLALHQDWRTMQGSLDALVVWVPMVDVDISLGAIEIIPGSHRWGLLSSDWQEGYGHVEQPLSSPEPLPVEVELGDVLFFSAFLVHRSGTNSTNSIRWSCQFRYNNLNEKTFIRRGYPHSFIYRPQEELITANFPQPNDIEQTFKNAIPAEN